MTNPKKYFNDRFVLLMLAVNLFLTVVTIASVLLRLGDTGNSYIKSYQANLGLDAYSVGGAEQLIAFPVFSVIVFVGMFFISMRLHHIRKHAAWIIMVLATLLLVLSLIIANSLLGLR